MIKVNDWIYLIDSWCLWNTTVIMVWVHGDEISWIEAINNLKDDLNIISWRVYIVYANLKAIDNKVRFVETNLNRTFLPKILGNSYEENRAREIIEILNQADFLLDIHNTTSYNSSLKILITTHTDYIEYFDVDKVVTHIWDVEKWGSDWYMDIIWKKWFCLECGSINFWDKNESYRIAYNSILNFLKLAKNIKGNPEKYSIKRDIIKMKEVYKTKTDNFVLKKDYKDFEYIKKWEIIAKDWDIEILSEEESIILFAHNRKEIWKEWFFLWKLVKY